MSTLLGGSLRNAIPRESNAVVVVEANKTINFLDGFEKMKNKIKNEFHHIESDITIRAEKVTVPETVLSVEDQDQFFKAVYAAHNGVFRMSPDIEDLVETSNNIAKINLEKGSYKIACHTRSSIDTERDELVFKIKDIFNSATVNEVGPYPGWKPQPRSNILTMAKQCFKALHGKEPQVKSIHAGLECGILAGTFPCMEMISFGPNIRGCL